MTDWHQIADERAARIIELERENAALRAVMLAVDDSLQSCRTAYQNGAVDVAHLCAVAQAECERLRYHAAQADAGEGR